MSMSISRAKQEIENAIINMQEKIHSINVKIIELQSQEIKMQGILEGLNMAYLLDQDLHFKEVKENI